MQLSVDNFIFDLSQEAAITEKLFAALTDESLSQKVYAEGRKLGRLAWHIVLCIGEMAKYGGLEVDCPPENAEVPEKAEDILNAYKKASQTLISEIKTKWTDEMLETVVDMYGEKWSYAVILTVIMRHEIHHRGQMTVLMRQAGLKVPGVYGPSKEEWVNYNMPPQE